MSEELWQAACNEGWVKDRRTLARCIRQYPWMTWFWGDGHHRISCTRRGIGNRTLAVVDGTGVPYARVWWDRDRKRFAVADW